MQSRAEQCPLERNLAVRPPELSWKLLGTELTLCMRLNMNSSTLWVEDGVGTPLVLRGIPRDFMIFESWSLGTGRVSVLA